MTNKTNCTNIHSTVSFVYGGEILISLDYRSGLPVYLQVVEGYKRLILKGVIKEGEKLPSVRELSSQLAINPNTIQRSYRELEAEGYVGSSPGKGVFVTGGDILREKDIESIYETIHSGIQKLLDYGRGYDDIILRIKTRFDR